MVDVSSYNQPLPVSPLELAGKLGALQQQAQQIQSGALQINQQKLDQANQAFGYMTRAMTSLGPNASKDEYKAIGQKAAELGLVPADMVHIWDSQVDAAPDSPTFFKRTLGAFADHQQQLNLQTGINADKSDSANSYQGKTDVVTGGYTPATKMPVQIPPGTPGYDQNNRQQFTPPAGPSGVIPVPQRPGLPVQPINPPAAPPPVSAPATAPLAAGPAPMFQASQAMLAKDRETATNKATALKPLEEAYDLAKLVSTGPGTEALNKARAYGVNAGLINGDEKSPTAIYAMLNKNLAQFIDKNGSRSDADLAVKESGNANAKTQIQPALLHMVQKIIGREKIEIARPGAFENSDVGKYSEHSSKFPTSQDERAYTIDKLKPEDARQLYIEMKNKALNGKGADQAEGIKFLKSLSIAKKQGLVNGVN